MKKLKTLTYGVLSLVCCISEVNAQTFTDVSTAAGFSGLNASWGMAWTDYDLDGDPDVYTYSHLQEVTGSLGAQMWRNNGNGTFTDVTYSLGMFYLTGDTHGVVFGDANGDARPDLYLVNGSVKTEPENYDEFWVNNANGTFAESAASAGLLGLDARGRGAYAFDANRDGRLDLFVTRFDRPDADGVDKDLGNQLFINNGNQTFTDIGVTAGISRALAENRAAGWGDYDGDGRMDILVTGPCVLWHANADGTYTDVTATAGIEASDECTAVGWADYDKDGDLDVYVSRGFDSNATDALYKNNGDGTFTNVASSVGIKASFTKRGVTWGDYDNDGDLDIYVVALNKIGKTNLLYRNKGDGTFEDVAVASGAGAQVTGAGSSTTFVDYDLDGDLDLFITNGEGNTAGVYTLLQNSGNTNNWLDIVPIGKTAAGSNPDALGTKIKVEATTTGAQYIYHLGPQHFLSQSLLPMHAGLGQDTGVNKLSVTWPSGAKQTVENVAAKQRITLAEGKPIWQDNPTIGGLGYYIWQSGKRWKIVFKGDATVPQFTGTITSLTPITNYAAVGLETDDVVTTSTYGVTFTVNDNAKGIDSIEFDSDSRTMTFSLSINGVAVPQNVYLGRYKVKPATLPLKLSR